MKKKKRKKKKKKKTLATNCLSIEDCRHSIFTL